MDSIREVQSTLPGLDFSLGAHVLGEVPTIRSVIEFVVYPYLLCYLLCVCICVFVVCR